MRKDALTELWQIKVGVNSIITQLTEGMDHLDTLTCRVIARALDEFLQETISLSRRTSALEIEQFAVETLLGTRDTQIELAAKWFDELKPLMYRTQERAQNLDHDLADFTCLSADGQRWGAICLKCLEWIIVQPDQAGGAVLNQCTGWLTNPFK